MIRKNGFAQIPLMLALLLMAIAVPAVTSLVQNNQDTRNRAASNSSQIPPTRAPTAVPSPSCYCSPQTHRWTGTCGSTISGQICEGGAPTLVASATPYPTTSTGSGSCSTLVCGANQVKISTGYYNTCYCGAATAATPTVHSNSATPTPKRGTCSGPAYQCSGGVSSHCSFESGVQQWIAADQEVCSFGCGANGMCASAPAPTPTLIVPVMTDRPMPTAAACTNQGIRCKGGDVYSCESYGSQMMDVRYQDCHGCGCNGSSCVSCPGVSATPTTRPMSTPTDRPMPTAAPCTVGGYHCKNGDSFLCQSAGNTMNDIRSEDCHGCGCSGAGICMQCSQPTAVPTSSASGCTNGSSCVTYAGTCFNVGMGNGTGTCNGGICCKAGAPLTSSTPIPTYTGGCKSVGQSVSSSSQCCSGVASTPYQGGGLFCSSTPTAAPTCKTNGQSVSSASQCCSAQAAYQGSMLVCSGSATPTSNACKTNGQSVSSSSQCCSTVAAYQGSMLVCTGSATPTSSVPTSGGGGSNPTATVRPTSGGGGSNNPTATTAPAATCNQCPADFKCYVNGTDYKWFVTGYVMNGYTASNNATCGGVAKPSFKGKTMGDANCDGMVNAADFSLWHKEFYDSNAGEVVSSNWHSDFTGTNGVCDRKVNTFDFALWHKNFYELMSKI